MLFRSDAFFGIRPVESGPGSAPLEILGIQKGREVFWNPVEAAFSCRFFLLFQLVPAAENLGRIPEFFPAEHVGMTADQFVGQLLGHRTEVEGLPFFGQLRMEKDVEQHISQLLLESVIVTLVDRFQKLVDFLKYHGSKGPMGLFPVPRAAPRSPKFCHDAGEGLSFAHPPPLRGTGRFVEPERDGKQVLVMLKS